MTPSLKEATAIIDSLFATMPDVESFKKASIKAYSLFSDAASESVNVSGYAAEYSYQSARLAELTARYYPFSRTTDWHKSAEDLYRRAIQQAGEGNSRRSVYEAALTAFTESV